ncbi:MAG: choice-of-anchor Q domain-containing protein [bacterium]
MKRISSLSFSALTLGFVVVFLAGLSLHHVQAAQILIPEDYSTIQSAIDAADDGDVITIKPGTYTETVNFFGKAIAVKSTDPNDPDIVACTIIDGGKAGSVVTFGSGEGKLSVLSGVTVQNGKALPPFGRGGGICCKSSSPMIKKCVITKNSALRGGGIYCLESSPCVSNCLIVENQASEKGGGIYGDCYSSPRLIQCTMSRNSALIGGGIYCDYYSSPCGVNSILWNNGSEVDAGYESSIKLSYCDVKGGYTGLGNIDADPLFVNPEKGDYHLKSASPCKGAGHPRMSPLGTSPSDMGAYAGEEVPCAGLTAITVAADGSGDFASIQQAIDFALHGDVIIVYPATYKENLVIRGKNISLVSQNGPASTIIDGSQAGPVIVLVNVSKSSSLKGFTIRNGSSIRYAGGIYCQNASPEIEDCIMSRNSSVDSGGGIGCDQKSSPAISNCTMSENSAQAGGGVYCDRSSPTIVACLITKNIATAHEGPRGGGGIYSYNSAPKITACTISNNQASCGGGILCFGPTCCQPKIVDCTIGQNQASSKGGGIYCQCDNLSIANSTIDENSADAGGGIYCTWPLNGFATRWTVTNCIISRNSANSGAGIYALGYYGSESDFVIESPFISPVITNCTIVKNSASLTGGGIISDMMAPAITNCILWENSPNQIVDQHSGSTFPGGIRRGYRGRGNTIQVPGSSLKITYSNIQSGYRGLGNINLPPVFMNPALGDYHLQYESPCIDAGTDPGIPDAEKDKESNTRPWDGDRDGMANYDMGAFEYNGFVPPIIWVSMDIYSGEGLMSTLSLRSRKVYVAVLGNDEFDVTDIDPETIALGRKGAQEQIAPAWWSYTDVPSGTGKVLSYYRSGDGYQDLLFTFNSQQVIRNLGIKGMEDETIYLTLSGNLKDGSMIKGLATCARAPVRRLPGTF